MNLTFNNIIDDLIKKNISFVIYTLPNSESPVLIVQKSLKLFKSTNEDIDHIKGFIVAPFESANTNIIHYLKSDFILEADNSTTDLELFLNQQNNSTRIHQTNNHISDKEEYLERATYLINKLKTGDLSKVVLSRVSKNKLADNFKFSNFYESLSSKYPNAFVYLLNSEETGIWAGASPETLIKRENKTIETTALAGTRLLSDYIAYPEWADKEKEEQHLVSIYIENLLSELGIKDYKEEGPITIEAGKLVHLKTKFSIKNDCLKDQLGLFIKGLHPTPAVCGLPKADAYGLIEKAENHSRNLYTGFLGPWNTRDKSHLFVNLRCAEFSKNNMLAYVGGGLTSESNALDEWQETENKLETMLSVVENL